MEGEVMELAEWRGGNARLAWERRAKKTTLTPEAVLEFRAATFAELPALAAKYGIGVNRARQVRRGAGWKWVENANQ